MRHVNGIHLHVASTIIIEVMGVFDNWLDSGYHAIMFNYKLYNIHTHKLLTQQSNQDVFRVTEESVIFYDREHYRPFIPRTALRYISELLQ